MRFEFQFYLSSIKSRRLHFGLSYTFLFQFYLSSIKRRSAFSSFFPFTCFNSTLVQLKAVKNANKYTSKSMIYHPFILIFYKHLQSTFNS